MKVKHFEIIGLFDNPEPIVGFMNSDLNLVTGRNGAGKTSILKLLWFTMSGNILLALKEVDFRRFTLETDQYRVVIHRLSRVTCRIEYKSDEEEFVSEDVRDEDGDFITNAEDAVNERLQSFGSSVFLPTFRRIEGGFGLGDSRPSASGWAPSLLSSSKKNAVETALQDMAKTLSNKSHTFVSSISTVDIATILLRKYTDLSDTFTKLQQDTSQNVINRIKAYEAEDEMFDETQSANAVIANIKSLIENLDDQRDEVMKPIEAVRLLVQRLLGKTGIKFGPRLSFGDAATSINSDLLSAGEKQMLSFICYNAFYTDSIIFIDEPELSLHVDWQRQLFSILMEQQSTNQFIVSTHSPFIYNKYPDKEIMVDSERGDELSEYIG